MDPEPARWNILGDHAHADCRVFTVSRRVARHPVRGRDREFFVLNTPDWVIVVAVTDDDRLVLVRQFRFGTADLSLEVPGGLLDGGEDPVTGGLRELEEETGYRAARARLLGHVHPNPAIMNNRCHIVLAEGCRRVGELAWDTDEELQVVLEPVEKTLADARTGALRHALTHVALFLFEPEWRRASAAG